MKFKLGTYNLRMGFLDTTGENRWEERCPRLMQSVQETEFDIWGVQEVDAIMQQELQEAFKNVYEFFFFSPYAENGNWTKAQGIVVRKEKYTISEKHFFWIGNNPEEMSKSDLGEKGNYNRGGCCAVITEKATNKKLFLMCTHACYNAQPNGQYAYLYQQMEEKYNTEQLPSFFVGDMNATPKMESSLKFKTYWQDAYDALPQAERTGNKMTYTGYANPAGSMRIDYIYYKGKGITPTHYHCENKLYDGKYASDHYPVGVDFEIE